MEADKQLKQATEVLSQAITDFQASLWDRSYVWKFEFAKVEEAFRDFERAIKGNE